MSLISVQNLSKSYFSKTILNDISFNLEEGDRLALIGENGSGKTTLMRIIAGEEKADSGRVKIASGQIVSYLSQQMEEFTDLSVPVLSSEKLSRLERSMREISEALAQADGEAEHEELLRKYQKASDRFERAGGYSYLPELASALAELGIRGEVLERPIASLSGGERMRVLMARRLLERADILLLDEPTNHLDINGLEWLERYLASYRGSVILISHDRFFIDRTATRTAELLGGSLYQYRGAYTDYVAQKASRIRQAEQNLKRLEEEHERQNDVKMTMLSHRKMSSYHSREKIVAKLEDEIAEAKSKLLPGERRMNFHFTPKQDKRDEKRLLLSLKEAEMAFDGLPPLFSDVNLNVTACDKKVLVGPNGCGKSTLLAMAMGKIQRFSGELEVASELRFGHLGQYTEFDDEDKTVLEELSERSLLLESDARNLLARYGFRENDVHKKIAVLSGGERSRLYLCCLLEEEPDILFLDEPTNHLDIHSREVLEDAIIDFNGAVLAVSHDRYFIEKCGFEILGFLKGGLRTYESYASYRHFARLAALEEEKNEADRAAEKAAEKNRQKAWSEPPEEKFNPVKLRRERKLRRQDLQALEKKIASAEAELEKLESLFGGDDSEAYASYANVQAKLENLYDDFFRIGSEIEEMDEKLGG